jgi:Ca2+-binding RTX toxin-like protein
VTLRVRTESGTPVVGGLVEWRATDGSAGSASAKPTDAAGEVRFGMVSGPANVTVTGGVVSETVTLGSATSTVFVHEGTVEVVLPDPGVVEETTRRVEVTLPDGSPVSEAQVTVTFGTLASEITRVGLRVEATYQAVGGSWQAPVWTTDGFGVVENRFVGFPVSSPPAESAKVVFSDGELWQQKTGPFDASGVARIALSYMPFVELASPADATVPVGGEVEVLVQAVDDAGEPISGASLTLEGTTTAADQVLAGARTGCVPKLTGTTNLNGWVRLRLCAAASGVWHADGPSLVPSAPVRVTVPTCAGRLATKVGTGGPDSLEGTEGPDVIVGLGGKDTIHGLGGNDFLCGGPGSDVIYGGLGNDRLIGGGGWDRLLGEGGDDLLWGQGGNDRLYGGTGTDTATGGAGTDTCVAETAFCEL